MSRPREFNEQQVLQAAMHVFWQKGYDATSIPDLLNATGLSRSSLYETFGDKTALFEAASNLYFQIHGAQRIEALRHAHSARKGLTRFFNLQIESCLNAEGSRGCLMTNTATSLESHDPRIEKLVRESTQAVRKELKELLVRAQKAGEIPNSKNVDALSHMLLGVSFGINVMARISPNQQSLQSMAKSAVETIS